jgi:hypothetical protein
MKERRIVVHADAASATTTRRTRRLIPEIVRSELPVILIVPMRIERA